MVIIEAKVIIKDGFGNVDKIKSGIRCSLKICEYVYYIRISKKDNSDILVNTYEKVIVEILLGEFELKNIQINNKFLILGGSRIIGKLKVNKILEIYIEKEDIKVLFNIDYPNEDKSYNIILINELISYSETLENALIFEDAYELVKYYNNKYLV